MSKKQMITSFIFKSEKDVKTAEDLLKSGHFDWCLFIWHLAIEKLLKAKIISHNKEIVFTHNLARLARDAEINISDKLENELKEITSFNVAARYDDYKLTFYKKAGTVYTEKWVLICRRIYNFIKKSL